MLETEGVRENEIKTYGVHFLRQSRVLHSFIFGFQTHGTPPVLSRFHGVRGLATDLNYWYPLSTWKEINDYKAKKASMRAALKAADAEIDGATISGLRGLLDTELDQSAPSRKQRAKDAHAANALPILSANRDMIYNLDDGMQSVRSHGLMLFYRQEKIKPFSNVFCE